MSKYNESETVELKEKYNDSFTREVVAFLNSNGGTIFIGIDDAGNVIGATKIDETLRSVSDCITDKIEPSAQSDVHSQIIYEDGKPVIAIIVNKGLRPLYCIKKYGFSSKGCLVRIGSTCKEMSIEEIQFRYRSQFKGDDYMLLAQSKYAPLSFDMMKIMLISRGLHVNDNSFESTFSLRRRDGSYNLLAEIMADKSLVPLIFVKFSGTDKTSISQRSDYGGQSLILGYQKLKDRLIAENICKTDTTVRPRIDRYLYDIDCVNEALVNMLVHNDWTVTEPLVSFYSDRVVFTSHGGLPQGVTENDFFNGVSHPRNSVLMRIFLNLGIVEHTGHGIPMIVSKYGKDAFSIHDSYIDVTIPFDKEVMALMPKIGTNNGTNVGTNNGTIQGDASSDPELTENEKRIVLELVKSPALTYTDLTDETGLSRRSVSRVVSELARKGYITRIGSRRAGFWKVIR